MGEKTNLLSDYTARFFQWNATLQECEKDLKDFYALRDECQCSKASYEKIISDLRASVSTGRDRNLIQEAIEDNENKLQQVEQTLSQVNAKIHEYEGLLVKGKQCRQNEYNYYQSLLQERGLNPDMLVDSLNDSDDPVRVPTPVPGK